MGFWAERLGPPAQAPQQYQPQGYVQQPTYQQPQGYQQQAYQQQPQASQRDVIGMYSRGEIGMFQAISIVGTKGGDAARRGEVEVCPECGGNNYFHRRAFRKQSVNGSAHASPMCFDCGYNGIYQQADPMNYQGNINAEELA